MFLNLVKQIAYFLIYQFLFVLGGQYAGYILYRTQVEPVPFESFSSLAAPAMEPYFAGGMAAGMLLSSLAMIAHLLIFKYVRIGKGFFKEVKPVTLIYSTLFVGSMMVLFNILAAWSGLENNNEKEVEMMLSCSAGVLSIAVFAPVLEELLFRGAIQGTLMRYFKNPWVAIIVSGLLFGVIHVNPIQVFYAACLGVGFGWLYYRTGSLLPAVIGHIVNNSIAAYSNIVYGSDTADVVQGGAGYLYMAIAAAMFMILFAAVLNSSLPKLSVERNEP